MSDVEAAGGRQTPVDWASLVKHGASPISTAVAVTFVRRFGTASQPVQLDCSGGDGYVVKALRKDVDQGRMMFNDHVVARLGALIDAPVPQVAFVNVSQELIDLNIDPQTQMGHLKPGLAHGSKYIPGVSERIDAFQHLDEGDNRERFAHLAVLFGWMHASDRQFIYEKDSPFRVYSHDHGHFFPGGPNWTVAGLHAASTPELFQELVVGAGITPSQIGTVCKKLSAVTDRQIASIVATPPTDWGVGDDERAELAKYLAIRRDHLAAAHVKQAKEV